MMELLFWVSVAFKHRKLHRVHLNFMMMREFIESKLSLIVLTDTTTTGQTLQPSARRPDRELPTYWKIGSGTKQMEGDVLGGLHALWSITVNPRCSPCLCPELRELADSEAVLTQWKK